MHKVRCPLQSVARRETGIGNRLRAVFKKKFFQRPCQKANEVCSVSNSFFPKNTFFKGLSKGYRRLDGAYFSRIMMMRLGKPGPTKGEN
jgi:hypothetical protein